MRAIANRAPYKSALGELLKGFRAAASDWNMSPGTWIVAPRAELESIIAIREEDSRRPVLGSFEEATFTRRPNDQQWARHKDRRIGPDDHAPEERQRKVMEDFPATHGQGNQDEDDG
jgi:hypothetical protein